VVAVARVPSVPDQREKEAQGHDRRGDEDDDQTRHPGSLQVLLASQPRTTPTPTSPLSLTALAHDWALRNTHRNTTAPTPAKA